MVSIREVERLIKKTNNSVQWPEGAKLRFASNMEVLMELLVTHIENSDKRKGRVSGGNVDTMFADMLHLLYKGEEE
jgi:hypothetical protein